MDASTNKHIKFGVKHGNELIIVFLVLTAIFGVIAFFVSVTVVWVILLVLSLISAALSLAFYFDKKRFIRYGEVIFIQGLTSIKDIAEAMNKLDHQVEEQLRNLISTGYFGVAKVENGQFLHGSPEGDSAPTKEKRHILCPGCGAPAKSSICEYCGSITGRKLQAE
ncbi:MAG: hypothetical protein FWE11_07585 [Defluviitaleaceae bacterium]|nr:hypothetical protein [Defluviitaleaceae bacterium]